MLQITPFLSIDENAIEEIFVRASGAGGQNVNKVSTAVQLRFDATNCSALTPDVRSRLLRLAGKRATAEGIILIKAQEHRTRERNRAEALARLTTLIAQATHVPTTRRATKPSRASGLRRLEAKAQRSDIKRNRRATGEE